MKMLHRIEQAIQQIRIIDGHEHLITAAMREKGNVGFFGLMHYLESDLISAGMKKNVLTEHSDLSMEEKADVFLRYWRKTSNTTYANTFKTAMRDLYSFDNWTVDGILQLNEKVLEKSRDASWYVTVLNEKSGIDLALTLIQTTDVDFKLFRPVMFLDFMYKLFSRQDVEAVCRMAKTDIKDLRSYLETAEVLLDKYVKQGMVASKLGHAYWRTLECGNPGFDEAEQVFKRILSYPLDSKNKWKGGELKPLQDYLIRHLVKLSANYQLPIQIHTGHQEPSVSGNGNILTHSRVTGLIPLFLDYPEARFVLLHSGLPYHDEYISIAKNFPNVYADMTWVYIISPSASKRILHQMIEMVPQSKILAFGGDYNYVEGTYAHQKLARRLLSEVLSEKVREGTLTETEAVRFAYDTLRGNLLDLYELGL